MELTDAVPFFFLLGGYDLEMITIRQLLERNGFRENRDFLDKGLSWGASLRDYADDFHPDRINVAIELEENSNPPERYLRIDHHGDWQHKPASIEQLANLLDIPLNRYEQLVAANDKGYIPAMEELDATREEIAQIRRADRRAQGVTEEDENLAEESIRKHLKRDGRVTTVKAMVSRFSPIADRLYGQTGNRLLIYKDDGWAYYGIDKFKAEKLLTVQYGSEQFYSGGGPDGFLGTKGSDWTAKALKKAREHLIDVLNQESQ